MSGATPAPISGADIRTFLFADMRGYTRYTQEHGDDAASGLAGRFADLVKASRVTMRTRRRSHVGDESGKFVLNGAACSPSTTTPAMY